MTQVPPVVSGLERSGSPETRTCHSERSEESAFAVRPEEGAI
jgi:hypothetical protein